VGQYENPIKNLHLDIKKNIGMQEYSQRFRGWETTYFEAFFDLAKRLPGASMCLSSCYSMCRFQAG